MVAGACTGRGRLSAFFAIFVSGFAAVSSAVGAEPVIRQGGAAVTGFSGVKTDAAVPKDVHPLDRTFIDLDGASARIFDLTNLGGPAHGQLADVPAILDVKARDVGQVFGVTLDDGDGKGSPPNAYLAATSLYGLHIVTKDSSGRLNRLIAGEPGAQWMPGLFGPGQSDGPGSIYKINGATGAVSLFATVKLGGRENGGAALGNLTFDHKSGLLFASDLETGMIHSFSRDGKERDYYDHGGKGRAARGLEPAAFDGAKYLDITKPGFKAEDPATWGYAEPRRRVFGLAVNMGRLYYSVAEGPSIWSVGIDDDGDFGSDARLEIDVAGTASDISDILFDGSGMLYLAQRGSPAGSYDYTKFAKPQSSAVLRYTWDETSARWAAQADEYAIGLRQDFRGTVGGIASGYGYDKYGKADFSQCRQTLWSTGEHLREGNDKDKIAKGGPRIVHGLQGVFKKSVLPKNAPPVASWFTDFDGVNTDINADGHVGDVAIFAPCNAAKTPEPSSMTEADVPPLVYVDPPVYDPNLVVDKVCHPGAIGSQIRCTITVSNVGSTLPVENVKVKDVTKIMFGPGAGTLIPIVAFNPSMPAIACTPVPSTSFSCLIPAGLLPPGASAGFDVFVDTSGLALAGNSGFRNCASINHPDGIGQACAEGGTDILVEKIGPPTCLPGGTCKYGLKLLNIGTLPFNGPVLLADAMFIGGATPNIPVTSVAPPIACIAGNTTQLPFTCLANISLMPGEERTHWIEVTMPAPGGYWAENCFGALDPALMGGAPVPPGLGGGGPGVGNPSCVWTHVKAPVANLKIEKTALHGGKCAKVGANLHCDYDISITNEDAVPFNAALKIDEVVPAAATITATTAPWACMGGPPNYTCHTGGAVMIPAGGTTSFTVTVEIGVVASEASMCKVNNTAKIAMPAGGAAPNLDPADDQASDVAWTFGLFWEDPITHITFVMCDPTNQKVKKTVSKPFQKTANGFEGEYLVTVTNTGPDPYQGPYKLNEKFAVAPASVSFDGDFTCAGGGTDYVCETPVKTMAKNAVVTLKVKATFADNGTCEALNTASLTMPPAGTKGNGDASDDSASASASLPSNSCAKRTPVPPVVIATCPDGLPLPRSGKCPCPSGTAWNRDSGQCQDKEEHEDPQQPQGCKPGVHEVKIGSRCVCAEGYSKEDGVCVKDQDEPPKRPRGCEPGPHEYKSSNGKCLCDDGYSRGGNGRCLKDTSPADDCQDKGWTWTGKRCVPPQDPGADCKESGGRWTGSKCVFPPKDEPPAKCPKGFTGTPPKCKPFGIDLPDISVKKRPPVQETPQKLPRPQGGPAKTPGTGITINPKLFKLPGGGAGAPR